MNILAIECTHAALSAAVMHAGVVTELRSAEWKKAAETLVPLVAELLEASALERHQLDSIAISAGPGSFTSLRIGMSVAKGMAYGLGKPLVPVPTLPAMAAALPAKDEADSVLAVIGARKGEYYFATYTPHDLAAGVWHSEVHRGDGRDVVAAATSAWGRTVVVGRQLGELAPALAESGAIYREADFFSARSLLAAAERLFSSADSLELDAVTPDYRQMFTPNSGRG